MSPARDRSASDEESRLHHESDEKNLDLSLLQEVNPNGCSICRVVHGTMQPCERLRQVAFSINLFAVPAFLTDPLNRFVWVNNEFARLVGDPIRDNVPPNMRFVPATVVGPYRDKFPRRLEEVAQCVQALPMEVQGGRLARQTLGLLQETFALDYDLMRRARKTNREWDGTMLIKSNDGKTLMVREQVVPLADSRGKLSGYNISVWQPVEREVPALTDSLDDKIGVACMLTPRQLEIARLFASGLTNREVASRAAITPGTARAHLEEIYFRLDIHSRAELTALLVREKLD